METSSDGGSTVCEQDRQHHGNSDIVSDESSSLIGRQVQRHLSHVSQQVMIANAAMMKM